MKKHKGIFRLFSIIVLAFMLLTGCADDLQYDADFSGSDTGGADWYTEEETIPDSLIDEDPGGEVGPTATPTVGPTATPADDPTATPTEISDDKETVTEQAEPTEALEPAEEPAAETPAESVIDENGSYSSKKDVALYIHTYGRLPGNFITKKEAKNLGWEGGSLEPYAPGKSIGGDYFGNYEGVLPDGNYHECDIDTKGKKSRGSKRIVFDDKGNIYYTSDHYQTFTQLY